ncbi:MAG: ribosomal protein S18-alanine N-acetyltransferase [Candidatus Promineifilaceae bacterium]|nr:ribosomal protein S18-alanine N-acetyltransferase [Candidatus Promineifilaceae bacterium]
MRLGDLEAVMAIESSSFPTPWPAEGYRRELTANERAYYYVLTGETGGERSIVGFAGHWLVAGEAHVSIIAVEPAWRGRGLGELLLLNLLLVAVEQGATLATLEVRCRNQVAQGLYHKYGFEVVGRRKGYYKDTGEDAILMTLPLDQETTRQRLWRRRDLLWQRLQSHTD